VTASSLRNILIYEADDACSLQHAGGSLPSGRNGAYGDPETPVRSTSHALHAFCSAYRATSDRKYERAAEKALAYLLAVVHGTPGCVIVRHAKGKDFSNGVLGQAFVVEALHSAWHVLGRSDAKDAAVNLIRRHTFDVEKLCWRRVTPTGTCISPDMTFNHQLYFAAAASMFRKEDEQVRHDVNAFLKGWTQTLKLRADGRVVHEVCRRADLKTWIRGLKKTDRGVLEKESAYHLYNCYAFALLARQGVDVSAFAGEKWPLISEFARSREVQESLKPEAWTVPLRSGTETRMADYLFYEQTFGDPKVDTAPAGTFLSCVLGPDRQASILSPDPVTQKARSYRYWRLLDSSI
jgi:hypothetical protein